MRKVVCLTIVPLAALVLAACGGAGPPTATPARIDAATVTPVPVIPERTPDAVTPAVTATAARPAPETTAEMATPGATRAASPVAVIITAAPTTRATAAPAATATHTASPARATAVPATAAPATAASSAARVTSIPASPPKQAVGTQTDGLALLNVRAGSHDGYTRFVFDFAKTDGSAAAVPRAQVWSQQGAVVVMIAGVRQDTFGEALGRSEQPVNSGSVIALYRIPTFDDAAVAYGVRTKGVQGVTVTTSTGPARLIVDIAD